MIEQMVPVELWDSTGFTSITLKEGNPVADEGMGDNYRIYTYDTTAVHIHANCETGTRDMIGSRFGVPIPELFDQGDVVNIGTTDGKKISVMQYDERSQPD